MTTSLLHKTPSRMKGASGHTLAEVLIAASLSAMLLAAILMIALFIMRSGVRGSGYSEMETETRMAFEKLGIDARTANAFSATFSSGQVTSFTLTIPNSDYFTSGVRNITYGYDSANKCIFSVPGTDPTVTTGRTVLINNVTNANFLRYNVNSTEITGTVNTGIKHIQISVTVTRGGTSGVVKATQTIRSSSFTLRNI